MILTPATDTFILEILKKYEEIEGNALNDKFQELFTLFSDDTDKNNVRIKVAALNKIYSTAILNINPVVDQIVTSTKNRLTLSEAIDYVKFVDVIAETKWIDSKNKEQIRNNLSFASKYVHFLSDRAIPIYDSYIWLIMVGYLRERKPISFESPKNYAEFYAVFELFKETFALQAYSNYQIDKFLWTYGKILLTDISQELTIGLEKAKSELRKRLK